jgi:hypothetical protein
MKTVVAPIKDKHRALIITIDTVVNVRGPGYFKLNTSLLVNKEYVTCIHNTIDLTLSEISLIKSKRLVWDMLKIRIKEASMKFSQEQAQRNKLWENFIEDEIHKLDRNEIRMDKDELKLIEGYKQNLSNNFNEIYDQKAYGCYVRSRINSQPKTKQRLSTFSQIEKSRQSHNCITEIKSGDGKVNTTNSGILKACTDFYKDLYTAQCNSTDNINKYLQNKHAY